MSTPYGHFWIIVLMTGGAVVMANITAKRPMLPRSQTSVFSEETKPVRPIGEQKPNPVQNAKIETPPPATSTSASHPLPQSQETRSAEIAREYKSIDDDIAVSFDQAATVAMRTQATATVETPSVEKPVTAGAPPLTSREISPSPEIFQQQLQPTAGATVAVPRADATTTTNLNMREGPGPKYVLVETLATATLVRVLEREGDWVHVQSVPSGQQGWVNGRFLAPKSSP